MTNPMSMTDDEIGELITELEGNGFINRKNRNRVVALIAAQQERLKLVESTAAKFSEIVDSVIAEKDGPHRLKWQGEWIDGPAADCVHSILRGCQAAAKSFTEGSLRDG